MKVSRPAIIAPLLFASLLATEKLVAAPAPPPGACIYALDSSASAAFQIAGAQSTYTACGVVVESTSSSGFEMEGAGTLYLENHAQVSVVGGASLTGQTYLYDTISGKDVSAVQTTNPGDPFASLAAPTSGTIVGKSATYYDMNSKPANNTISPGIYCGGLEIGNTNGTTFTFSPGVYILAGGGLTLESQAHVAGTGVTFYNTSSSGWGCSGSSNYTPVTISGQVTATFSAPTSGTYKGILFFGNRTGCSTKGSCTDQINGGSTAILNGALYFASDEIMITGSNASGYMELVADKIYINGNSNFGNNGNPFDGITVSVSPSTATLSASQSQQFTATVANSANTAVTWTISPSVGSISTSGLYTAPSSITVQQTVTVTATSQTDTSKTDTATITLTPPIVLTAPTITFSVSNKTYGVAPFAVAATSNSSGAFTYSVVSGPATISGSTVTITGVGTVVLQASQAAGGNYTAGTANASFTVSAEAPTITFSVSNNTYGVAPFTVAATSNSSGAITYSVVSGPATLSGSTVTITGIGTVVLQASQVANGNYTAGTQNASFTISTEAPTITFTVANQTYGASPFAVSASSNSSGAFTYSVVSGPATFSGSMVAITGIGTVVLQASQAASGNYTAGTQNASFTVSAEAPTITFTVSNQTYGAAPFTIAASSNSSGAITYSVVSGPATISGSTVTITGVGTVVLQASQAASGNYTADTQNALFTVSAEAQTITFTAPASPVTYGVSPIALSASASSGLVVTFSVVSGPATVSGSTLTITGPGTVVVAANQAGNADYAAAQQVTQSIVVNPSVSVTVAPLSATLSAGRPQQFTATVGNTSNTAVTWTISPSGVGSISSAGLYIAPSSITTQQMVIVTATSQADTSQSASATVTLSTSSCAPSGYGYQRTIVIDHTKVPDSDQSNFPFLLSVTDPLLENVSNGGHIYSPAGNDIIFSTDPAGLNLLNYELQEYSGSNGQVIAWIQIPTLSHSTDTTIYMSYGNPGVTASQANPTAVWDSNYLGVWHLPNGSTLSANDSTSNGQNGTLGSTSLPVAGPLGGGANVNSPNTGAISIPAYSSVTFSQATFSSWVDMSQANSWAGIVYSRDAIDPIGMDINGSGHLAYTWNGGDSATWGWDSGLGFPTDSWAYAVITIAPSGATAYVCQAGSCTSSFESLQEQPQVSTTPWYLGSDESIPGSRYWGGSLEESRISNVARSSDWIATEFANQGSPATFYSISSETDSIAPSSVSLYASQSQQFTVTSLGACGALEVNWAISPAGAGAITASGLYTAPSNISSQQAVTVLVTNQSGTQIGSANVTLYPPVGVSVAPADVTLYGGQTAQFTATLNNATNTAVAWTISPAGVGTISSTGLYSAPSSFTTGQTVTITATSQADNTESATAIITLTPYIYVTLSPTSAILPSGQTQQFTATVVDTNNQNVTWAISPTGAGTINSSGLYTAPASVISLQTVTVTATSQADATKSASAAVTLTPISPISGPAGTVVTISGVGFGTAEGSSSVTVGGFPAVSLMWSDSQIQVQIPSGTGLGNQEVVVTVNGQVITDVNFTVTAGLVGIAPSPIGTAGSVTFGTPGQSAPLIFNGTAGQLVAVQLSSSTFSEYCNGGNFIILNPDGSTLTNQGFCGGGAIVPVTLPATGTYTLVISPGNSGATGSATATLWLFYELTGTITSGIPVNASLNIPGQVDQLTFSGTAGQVANVVLSNSTFSEYCNGGNFIILNPNGSTLTNQGICNGNAINPVTLPATGTYTLAVSPGNGSAIGSATVTLWVFYEQTGTITSGTPVNTAFNIPGQDDQLSFSGTAGQVASVALSNSTFDQYCSGGNFIILNPDGSTLTNQGICNGNAIGSVTLPATGTYTLVVSPGNGTSIGSATVLLTLSQLVTISGNLMPAESQLGSSVMVNLTLTTNNKAVPTGTVSCSGSGATSPAITVNVIGGATVPINGLPLGNDAIVCAFTSNNLPGFSNSVSSSMIESVIPAPASGTVTVSPASPTLYGGQVQQFTASVFNTANQAVTWTISPAGSGVISATGLYTTPASIASPQVVTVTATSQAYPTQSGSAIITLSPPQCASSGYSFQRSIVIDHTKIPNTDQANFPFLFNTTDPTLATVANGGHVSSSSGYDIFFSTDPAGLTSLDYEMEQYDPVHGQVVAWVRIPTLSHTADTVLYVFYGNPNVTASQQNPSGVWDVNYTAVYHMANAGATAAPDSTANGNTATLTSVSAVSGEIDGAGSFSGASSYMQIPQADFAAYPTSGSTTTGFSTSFGVWFKTATAGVILGQTDGTEPGGNPSLWQPALYVDAAGLLRASAFLHGSETDQIVTTSSYNDNNWHFAVDTYSNGTEELYVDGQLVGSQQVSEYSYNSAYAYFVGTGETANWPAGNGSWFYLNGDLDEVTVSSMARSADWIQTEYVNQSSPSTFYSLHPENAVEVTPSAVSLTDSQSQQFTLLGSVAGSCSSPTVIWSMPSGMPGTLTASGVYTAPNSISSQQTVPVTATVLGDSTQSITAFVTLTPALSIGLTPGAATLTNGQTQQFTASVANASSTGVTWTLNPAGVGAIDATGFYTAPAGLTTQQTVTITAASQADATQSASATVTLSPTAVAPPSSTPCASTGYGFQRVIVIDHTKIPNTDQANFPFLFNTTDPDLATTTNGGQVTNPNGYDIIFSTDPNGLTKLDHELGEYNPATGQVIAWIRIPTLSHTTDTVLYVFYGNPNVTSSQQNATGVWNSNYQAVYHLANPSTGIATDSTALSNSGTLTAVSSVAGEIDGAAVFNGGSSYIQIPSDDFPSYPAGVYSNIGLPNTSTSTSFAASFGVWFKTASAGGILVQAPSVSCIASVFGFCIDEGSTQPGIYDPAGWNSMLYVDDKGKLVGSNVTSTSAYNDNNWHFAVVTYATDGTNTLFVDGQSAGSTLGNFPPGYSAGYSYFVGTAYTFLANDGNWNWLYLNGTVDEVTVSNTPFSADWIQTEYNNQGSPSTFYKLYPRSTIQVAPSSASLYASQSQQFAVPGTCDAAVAWTMASGAPGTLTSRGLYTAPSGVSTQQTVAISASSLTTGMTVGSATVTLLTSPSPITLAASAQSPYTTGTSQTFTATVSDQDGNPLNGVTVTFSVTGTNPSLGSIATSSNGTASYTYAGAITGTDTIQATASVQGQLVTSSSISVAWIAPGSSATPEGVTLAGPPALGPIGLVGAFTDGNGDVIEPIAIGASQTEFVVPTGATQLQLGVSDNRFAADGGSGFVVAASGTTVAVPATALPWNWAARGLNSSYQYGPSGELSSDYPYGPFDATNPVVAATGLAPGGILTVAYQSGAASANFPALPPVNANGEQSVATGANISQGTYYPTEYTTGSSYPLGQPIPFNALVTNASGLPMANVPVTLTVSGANPQQLQATTDSTGTAAFLYTGTYAGTDYLQAQALPAGGPTLVSVQTTITWINYPAPAAAGSIALQRFAVANDVEAYTVQATDNSGNPIPYANIGFYVWGTDNFAQGVTTDSGGNASFNYVHSKAGPYNVVAVDSVGRNVVFSSVYTNTWVPPGTTNGCADCNALTVSITAQNAVTLPATLQLTGSAADTTLPSGTVIPVLWTQVSGPGTVTFAAPQQQSTTASFSAPGVYMVQLTATDSDGTASAQFQITVSPAPATGVPQGWIGSPLYGATVSGLVPVTLGSGISLQSGLLTYFPTGNTGNITVLNANVTGTGQIGLFDTTTVANGSYWIQLQGTTTGGNSEYSLILLNVNGNYKPGRVTATVTDLVVPATGLAINIQRTYDSLNAATIGDFGYGWNLGINVNLTVGPDGSVTFTLGGQRRTFYLTPQPNGFLPYDDVAFTPEPGFNGKLADSAPGCANYFDFVVPAGSLWLCVDGGQYSPPGYIYTDPNGTSYTISAAGGLQSIVDRSGNGLTITPNGITSTTGLNVPFVRDAQNRITQITDPQGNIYTYGYDGNGNLASVTYPNTSQPSTYTYAANHYYLSGTDFRANPLPVTAYYGPTDTDPNGLPLNGRLQSVTDSLGETTSYAYNLATNSTTITYPADASGNVGTATMVYDSYGMLLSSTDPLGHTTTNVYDANHNLVSVTDPLQHTTTYTYDQNGNKTSSTYQATGTSTNTTSTTQYNQYSEPTQTTDELGNVRVFNYDASYNPQSVTDSIGTLASFLFNPNQTLAAGAIGFDITANPSDASQFAYDANGNMIGRTDALGRNTGYVYNALGQKTSMTAPTPTSLTGSAASTTNYTYDQLGNLTQTAAPLARTTSSTYDGNGNKVSDTDARGNVTGYKYDALNRLIETDYPDSTKATKTYDFRNNVLTETDQNGNVTQHQYDLAGRQISVTRGYGTPSASTTSYAYDNAGRKTSETDALLHTTGYNYDAAGNLTAIAGVKGNFTYGYDYARNRVSQTDARGNTTQFQYDARKRLTKTTYPDATTVVNAYDGPGNLASVTDQAGNVVQYTFDAANQLKTVVQTASPNTANNTNFYAYDALGNLTGLTDENLHTTQNLFDLYGEPLQKTLPDQTLTESRSYDPAGNLVSLTHFNGVTTSYVYDQINRLTQRSTPGEATVSFTYTPTGKYLTSTAGDGTVSYGYDSLDRLITKATPEGTLSYTYDAAGHVASIQSSNANGANVGYTYDIQNRLSAVVDNNLSGNNTTTYTYDPASNLATATYPNGVQSAMTYDALNRITGLATQNSSYAYQRGPTGTLSSASESNGRAVAWNYDGIYRLTNESITGDPANNNGSANYGLDPVGNRLSELSSLGGVPSGSWGFNADDEISSETYDPNGNVLTTHGMTYTYDSENHMMLASGNGKTITMVYDAFGNRVAKTVNGVTTQYLVEDDVNPTGLPQVLEELTGPIGSGVVTRTYTYGLQRISENQVIDNAWIPSFYSYDGGSVRQLTNTAGAVTDTYEFDAFGIRINSTGTTPNSYLYRGEQFDPDLGLYYLRARYYNPATGRFLSRDPEDGKAIDPKTLHKYLYAGGDPVNKVDSTGREEADYEMLTSEGAINAYRAIRIFGDARATAICDDILVLWQAENPLATPAEEYLWYQYCLVSLGVVL
jgi:RHS repeat-associated protein